jgi:hypothetical protein
VPAIYLDTNVQQLVYGTRIYLARVLANLDGILRWGQVEGVDDPAKLDVTEAKVEV